MFFCGVFSLAVALPRGRSKRGSSSVQPCPGAQFFFVFSTAPQNTPNLDPTPRTECVVYHQHMYKHSQDARVLLPAPVLHQQLPHKPSQPRPGTGALIVRPNRFLKKRFETLQGLLKPQISKKCDRTFQDIFAARYRMIKIDQPIVISLLLSSYYTLVTSS